MPVQVHVGENEPIESALKRFKKVVEKEDILQRLRTLEYYEKPSTVQHRKNIEKKKRLAQLAKKQNQKDDKYEKKMIW